MADVSTVLVDSGALSSPPDPAVPVAGDEITVDVESSTSSGLTVGTPAPPAGSATVETDVGGSPSQGAVGLPLSAGATVETASEIAGDVSAEGLSAETTRALAAEAYLQSEIDALAGDTETKIDRALDPIRKRQDDSDDAAAEAAAAEAAARQALSTAVTQALAQASSDIQAAHDAADLAAQQAADALAQAKGDLQDAIDEAASDLQTAIAAVQASSDGVAAALASESTVRHDADSAEATARTTAIAGVQSGLNTLAAALTTEQTTRADADSAEVSARTAAVAGVQHGVDTVTAGLANEITVRAAADSAETSARQTQVSQVQNAVDTVAAGLTSEATTRANADSAETSARQSAISSLQGALNSTNAALSAEATTRATNDSAETSQRQAAVASLQGAINDANAAIVSEANTRATNDSAETTARQAQVTSLQGQINTTNAALTSEANTRSTADAAETSARQAAISSLQGAVDTVNAALTNEANTRATADAAETNARQSAVASLQGAISDANAAISNEANTRATNEAAETAERKSAVSAVSAKGSPKRIWTQSTAPVFADLFPPGVQACVFGNLDNPNPWGAGLDTWTSTSRSITCGMDLTDWTLDGGHTLFAWLNGAWAAQGSYECFDINTLFYGLTPGATYEFSAYTGAHRCRVFAAITWLNSSGAIISGDGGPVVNDWEAGGGSALSGYKRVWVRAVAPAGAVTAYFYIRGDNQGANNKAGQAAPYIFATHWQVARVPAGAAEPIDWQPYDAPAWINTGDANRLYRWSGIYGATWVEQSDTRIAANAAAITSEAATRASADAAETSQRQSAISGVQAGLASTNAALASEAATRATADSAETNARTAAVASLQDGLNAANAAIVTEQNARVTADSSEASARTTLSSSLSAQINPKRIFASATAPTFDQLFPPNVQACPVANLKPADGLNGIGFWTNTARSLADTGLAYDPWQITGERSVYAHLAGSWAADSAYECFDINAFGYCYDIVAGRRYEFSVYTGAHRCRGIVGIVFQDNNLSYISEAWSDGSGTLYAFGGVNAAEKNGGNALSDWKRLGCIAQAPAGATRMYLIVRADNTGFGGQGDPYVFACRPYFGLARNDQTTLTDWQPFQPALWMNPNEGNKPYLWSGIYGAGFVAVDDTRLSAHSTSISQLMSATDGLKAMWGVQINTDGKVVGRVKLDGSGGTSEFSVLATSFTVSMPGYNSPIFEVGYVGGSPKVTIRADVIQDGSITDGKVGNVNLNAPTFASGAGSASITVALRGGQPVAIIAKCSSTNGSGTASFTLKQGATTLATETTNSVSVDPNTGQTYVPPMILLASFTPPSTGDYTFTASAASYFSSPQVALYVDRPYK